MSKFCKQCGVQLNDDDAICTSCGASQDTPQDTPIADEVVASPNGKSKPTMIAATAVVIVLILLILKLIFGGGGYKEPIDNLFKAIESGKGKYLYEAMPEVFYDELDEFEDMSKSEIIDEFDELAESILEDYEYMYGDDIKISVKYKDKEKIDKDDLEDIQESIEDETDSKVKVSKGYEVDVKLTIKGDDDKETETTTINVYKIDGDWCLIDSFK